MKELGFQLNEMKLEKANMEDKWEKFEANAVKVLELSQHLQIENLLLKRKQKEFLDDLHQREEDEQAMVISTGAC